LYDDLASWWPLLSSPDEYAREAECYRQWLTRAARIPVRTVLELGSGGGNNASHLKAHFDLTLVDLSPAMLRVSRGQNPECEHVHGDMRDVRLGRLFDAVFIHDAISYMTTEADLARAIETAWVHCRPGGAALFCPDHVKETFQPGTDHGGHDRMLRSLRYLEWTYDPDPNDTSVVTEMAYVLRDESGVRVEHDQHVLGLFPRSTWLRLLTAQGFEVTTETLKLDEPSGRAYEAFLGARPESQSG
jgi:SAM-dependent methyltransferase